MSNWKSKGNGHSGGEEELVILEFRGHGGGGGAVGHFENSKGKEEEVKMNKSPVTGYGFI